MKKAFYLFNPGRLSRRDNTLVFQAAPPGEPPPPPTYLPIETVGEIFVFGSLDANSALYNFLAQRQVVVHFFDYYEHYTGSFMPREGLQAGKLHVEQTKHYLRGTRRMPLARAFVAGGAHNMMKTLRYYHSRGADLGGLLGGMEALAAQIGDAANVPALMGTEGNIRMAYYEGFNAVIKGWVMEGRTKNPPLDEVNAAISFGNALCYTTCLDAIRQTALDPTVGFLHEPGFRRYTLCLDLSEVFKPILVDRVIFKLFNKQMLRQAHFEREIGSCLLTPEGRKVFVQAYAERLEETIEHRALGRKVSYKHLVRLECYKLAKHLLGMGEYVPFKAWW